MKATIEKISDSNTSPSNQLLTGNFVNEKQEDKDKVDIESTIKKFVNSPEILKFCVMKNPEENENLDILSEAKKKQHVQTDILDNYANVMISKDTISRGKEIYKIIIGATEYILKATNLEKNEDVTKKLSRMRDCYDIMKKLGSEHPYFIGAFNIKEVINDKSIRVETLLEHGGKSLDELMQTATNKQIKRWMMQSIDAFMYSEERRICHFDIKPQNIVYKDGILKVIDLEASIEFKMKEEVFKQLRESGKTAYECTKVYAPMEAEGNITEWIGDKFDVYCWALSFYQICTKASVREVIQFKNKNDSELEYKKVVNEIRKSKKLLELDAQGKIADVISRCLNNKPKERPSFREISVLLNQIDDEIIFDDLQIADAKHHIGMAYQIYTSNFLTAFNYLEKILKTYLKLLGEEHANTAKLFNNIGSVYNSLSDKTKALEYYEKSLCIRLKLLGEEHIDTAISYNSIGLVHNGLGHNAKSLEYLEKSLCIRRKLLGEEHIETAMIYNSIGAVNSDLGEKKKAFKYYEKAMNIRLRVLGEMHIDTAVSYINIATVYYDLGDKMKSLEYHEKALNINAKLLGEEHVVTAKSYNNIGMVYKILGDKTRALEYLEKALGISLKLLDEEHVDISVLYDNIGSLYNDLGNKKKALEYHKKALNIYIKWLGEQHVNTATTYSHIAAVYNDLGKVMEALEFYEKALNIKLKLLGEEHADIAKLYNNIGSIYHDLDDKMNALQFYEKSLNINIKIFAEENMETAALLNNIGLLYNDLGDKMKALEYIEKSLKIRIKILGEENKETATAYNNIGLIYHNLGDKMKALEYFEKSLNIQFKFLGEEHVDIAKSYINIGTLYNELGDKMIAFEYFDKSLNIFIKKLGSDHPYTKFIKKNIEIIKAS